MSREEFNQLGIENKACVEIASCALALMQCKWWQFKRKRRLLEMIDLIRSCYNLKPFTFFNH